MNFPLIFTLPVYFFPIPVDGLAKTSKYSVLILIRSCCLLVKDLQRIRRSAFKSGSSYFGCRTFARVRRGSTPSSVSQVCQVLQLRGKRIIIKTVDTHASKFMCSVQFQLFSCILCVVPLNRVGAIHSELTGSQVRARE